MKSQQAEIFRFNPQKQIKPHHSILIIHPDDRLAAQIISKCIRHLPCNFSHIFTNSKKLYDPFFPYPCQDATNLNAEILQKIWKRQGGIQAKSLDKSALSSLQMDALESTTDENAQKSIMESLQPKFTFTKEDLAHVLANQSIPTSLVKLVNRYTEIPLSQIIIHHYFSPLVSTIVTADKESKSVGQKVNASNKQFSWTSGAAFKACMNCEKSSNLLRIVSLSGSRHKMPSPSVCKSFDYIFIFDRDKSVAKTISRIFSPIITAQTPSNTTHIMPSADALMSIMSQLGPREGFVLSMSESPPKMYWTTDILRT
jgi:hypothetical protein